MMSCVMPFICKRQTAVVHGVIQLVIRGRWGCTHFKTVFSDPIHYMVVFPRQSKCPNTGNYY